MSGPLREEASVPNRSTVGWVGLGNMGSRMVPHLLRAGRDLFVFDLMADRMRAPELRNATPTLSLRDLARMCGTVVTMLPSDASLLEAVMGTDGLADELAPGACLIDMSTVSPAASLTVADALATREVAYLRATVSGSTVLAAEATLGIFVSGDPAVFESNRALLALLGTRLTYVGGGEEARIIKLVVNLMVAVTNGALAEAVDLGCRHGLDRALVLDAIAGSAAGSPYVHSKVDKLKHRDFSPAAPVTLIAKDLDLAIEAGRRSGAFLPLAALARQSLAALEGRGAGGLDMAAVITLLEGPSLATMEA